MNTKKKLVIGLLLALIASASMFGSQPAAVGVAPDETPSRKKSRISSRVEKTKAGELILVETVIVAAPVDKVWDAYTTSAGFASWAAPVAEVDLRIGGSIRTNYDPKAKIGDPNTNTLRIVSYVPRKLLTLQADVSQNWPDVLKKQAADLYNVILFEEVAPAKTRLISYGLGYRDNKEMRDMMGFFIKANKTLYAKLIAVLE